MDRDIHDEVRRRRTLRIAAVAVVLVAVGGFALAATVDWLRPALRRSDVVTARVERGALEETLPATGTIVPRFEQVISTPVEARVTGIRLRAGDAVRRGDELLSLDTSASRLDADRLRDRVMQKESEGTQLALALDESIASLRAQIEQTKLDNEIAAYTAAQKRKLREAGLVAEQDHLAAAAQALKSEITLQQLQAQLVRALRTRDARLAASRSDAAISRRELDEARRQLQLAMLRAERDGVVTWIVDEEGATVRRGEMVARIADLSAFRVEATISDVHAARIAPGLRARVKLDDRVSLGGTVESVDPRMENGVARFRVVLDDASHARLRNNMRVDVSVVTGSRANTLVVRRGALARSAGSHLFVVRGDSAVRTPVRFGAAGEENVEILAGVRAGDEVIVSDMSDYAGVRAVRLKEEKSR